MYYLADLGQGAHVHGRLGNETVRGRNAEETANSVQALTMNTTAISIAKTSSEKRVTMRMSAHAFTAARAKCMSAAQKATQKSIPRKSRWTEAQMVKSVAQKIDTGPVTPTSTSGWPKRMAAITPHSASDSRTSTTPIAPCVLLLMYAPKVTAGKMLTKYKCSVAERTCAHWDEHPFHTGTRAHTFLLRNPSRQSST